MHLYIMTDIEGISGIYTSEQVVPGRSRFDEGRRFLTADINACAAALKEAGVERVTLRDCHGGSYTVLWDALSGDVDRIVAGDTGDDRFAGLDDSDGVILLGYHAMAGTSAAILEHSMSSATVQNYWIHGRLAGEVAIDAGILGDRGKPVIMVSGDDKVCAEAKALLPWIATAQVKEGLTTQGGILLPQRAAHQVIRRAVHEAVEGFDRMKPLVYDKPVRFRVELVERHAPPRAAGNSYFTLIDGRTYEVEGDTMEEALYRSW